MKRWSDKEMQYLEDKWGTVSIPGIAKKLGRTVNAIKIKAIKRGLGAHLLGSDRVSLNAIQIAITGHSGSQYTSQLWVKHGLPIHRHKVENCYVTTVDMRDFWKWAETHKAVISFARLEEGALGAEPAWVNEKRKNDQRERRKKVPWTKTEDAMLEGFLKQGCYTYTDLASLLDRSQASIKTRIYDIGIGIQPVRASCKRWTTDQEARLMSMYYDGRSWDAIGLALGRSGAAARGRFELIESRRRITPCNTIDQS